MKFYTPSYPSRTCPDPLHRTFIPRGLQAWGRVSVQWKPRYTHLRASVSLSQVTAIILWEGAAAHEQLIRVRFALIYRDALSRGRGTAGEPMAHVEDIGIPAVGRLDKINTAVKRNAIKM